MAFTTPYFDKLYYGPYGGCFISDAFTVSCDSLYEDYTRAISQPGFWSDFKKLVNRLAPVDIKIGCGVFREKKLRIIQTRGNPYPIIGHVLLAQKIKRRQILFAPHSAEEAVLCARTCAYLDLPLKMHLPRSLKHLETLILWLDSLGVELETELCETFDLPEMYAFQEWVSAPDNTYCVCSRSNVGAFPAPLMTTALGAPYGDSLKALLKEPPNTIVVPVVSGSMALTVMKPWFDSGVKLYTVEIDAPDMWEELDSFCGSFTKVMRNQTQDRVLAPELANAWDEGTVERGFVGKSTAAFALQEIIKPGQDLISLGSAAALNFASCLEGDVLVVCGAPQMGTSL